MKNRHDIDWDAIETLTDKGTLRPISIVDPSDEIDNLLLYCDRHEKDMIETPLMIKKDGLIHTTGEGYSAYICPVCMVELAQTFGIKGDDKHQAKEMVQAFSYKLFTDWYNDEHDSDLFVAIGEGTIQDMGDGASFVAFK